jgi:hypothetical protein
VLLPDARHQHPCQLISIGAFLEMLLAPSAHHRGPLFACAALVLAAVASNACAGSTPEGATSEENPTAAAPTGSPAAAPPAPSGSSSAPDAGDAKADAGPPNPYLGGVPISAPAGTWTYVPMNDVVCGDGSTSGVSVNMSSTPGAPLLVFMTGGGACWDALTCLGGAAANVQNPVGEAVINETIPHAAALFDRTTADNPFKDASFVFVPYCTGDLHAGDAQKTYKFLTQSVTIQHRGARNTDAIVKRLLATFPAPPKLWLTGASGGGYGAMLSHHRFKAAWPGVRIDLLDDCGPPTDATGSTWQDMQASWKLELPPGCVDCGTHLTKLVPHLASTMGQGRFALLESTEDKVIRQFTGQLVAASFTAQVMSIKAAMGPTQRTYLIAGDTHVLLKQSPLPVASSGVTLTTWLKRFATDDPAWAHEGP